MDRLRQDGDAVISLAALEDQLLVGHAMFSRMAAPFRALGLAPVAVLLDWRRRGIAARLIAEGLRRATRDGWDTVFVLGDPDYYGRFGFSTEMASGFESPYAGPYFMALPLKGVDLSLQSGRVDYAPAFSALAS